MPYLMNSIVYDHDFGYMISPHFFSCFQNFDFLVVSGVKEQKIAENDQTFPFHISGTMHHIIFIYATLVKNDDISRAFSHIFKILIFQVISGVKGQKKAQNDKKFCCPPFLRNHTSYDCHL